MADPIVHLTNGIPDAGTGNITTLGQTLLDGANITLGANADAVVAAGAAGSVQAKLRAISRDIVANIVLAAGSAIIGLVKLSDGTNTTAVKAASTAPAATDPAAVVAISPNSWDVGVSTGGSKTQRVAIDTAQLAALSTTQPAMSAGFQAVGLPSDLPWPKGLSNRAISAAFTTLTRPANTTAYTAGDSISNNATAGSVTALTATLGDVNDDPVFLSEILITSTDTGLAGKRVRAYVYNSDPTASSGVSGGDNAAFSNKVAGYIGSFSGRLEAGFSDGTVGRLVPSFQLAADTTDLAGAPAGGFIPTKPTSGAKTLFIQFQAIDAFTPSASSTTIIATARGWQARAA